MNVVTCYSLAEIDPGNRLLADYLSERLAPGEFFGQPPWDDCAPHCPLRRVPEPEALSEALAKYQQRIGADQAAVDNAHRLADPAVQVVTVGQQPGLLTGPLYTPYKAVTAISLARHLGRLLDRPAVPVFWAGCDDDDRAEVDHCGCWDQRGQLHGIRYPEGAGEPGQLVGNLPVGEYAGEILAQLEPLLAGLPHADETLALVSETAAASADFGEWFARLLARLFGPLGLVVCDPRLPAVRRLGAEVLRRELAEPLRTTKLVNAAARKLHDAGYQPQLTRPDDALNLFFFDGRRRQRVTWDGRRFIAGEREYTREELLARLDADPGSLLPNAVLRPVMQEYLFGSAAFVAGPNELCYWAELLPVFRALEVEMPPVIPRAGATLLTPNAADFLRTAGIDPLRLLHAPDEVRLSMLADAQPPAVKQSFEHAREEVQRLVAELTDTVSGYEPTLAASAQATHQRMLNEIERLEHKTLKAVERHSSELSARLERTAGLLFPGRGLQERLLNICAPLARFGMEWPKQLLELLDGQEGYHLFVEV
ncbi:MAG: bacillithiol biosynthesis cysteine-adding enzyme BshC [Armatimonadota bacterium]